MELNDFISEYIKQIIDILIEGRECLVFSEKDDVELVL